MQSVNSNYIALNDYMTLWYTVMVIVNVNADTDNKNPH